jgi:hypothetical protein
MKNWPPLNPDSSSAQPPVRILMKDGKWTVPPGQRPILAPPPVEHKRETSITSIRGNGG